MRKLVIVVAVLVASTACSKKKEQAPAPASETGSAAGSASGTATGSASGSAAGSAADSGSGSAAAAAAMPADGLVITEKGLGALAAVTAGKDEDRLTVVKKALAAYPELSVDDDVMDMGGEVEHEEQYTSVKKGETEVLQIFDAEGGGYEVKAVDPMISTSDGLKQGDLVSAVAEKRKDLTCTADKASQIGLLTCTSAAEPHLVFVIDAENYKGATKGAVDVSKIATRKIVEIVR